MANDFCWQPQSGKEFAEKIIMYSPPTKFLGGGFKYCFSSLPGEMIQFDLRIIFKWVETKPPPRFTCHLKKGKSSSEFALFQEGYVSFLRGS